MEYVSVGAAAVQMLTAVMQKVSVKGLLSDLDVACFAVHEHDGLPFFIMTCYHTSNTRRHAYPPISDLLFFPSLPHDDSDRGFLPFPEWRTSTTTARAAPTPLATQEGLISPIPPITHKTLSNQFRWRRR